MLGFELDFWDYLTFATAALAGGAGILIYIWIAGLPGRIAIARKHPEAEAVKLMGWAGLLPTILPWIQAFIWAFKPTDIVDIRRFPREEARAIDEDIGRLTDDPREHGEHAKTTDPVNSARDASAPPPSRDDGTKA
jgi:Protein of unknown function (DUF3302)